MKNNITTNYNVKAQEKQDEIFRKMSPGRRAELSARFSDFVFEISKWKDKNGFSRTAKKISEILNDLRS